MLASLPSSVPTMEGHKADVWAIARLNAKPWANRGLSVGACALGPWLDPIFKPQFGGMSAVRLIGSPYEIPNGYSNHNKL